MRAFLVLIVTVAIIVINFSWAQNEMDEFALRELCHVWRNPNFLDWPEDCNATAACSTWKGVTCDSNRAVTRMFVIFVFAEIYIHNFMNYSAPTD